VSVSNVLSLNVNGSHQGHKCWRYAFPSEGLDPGTWQQSNALERVVSCSSWKLH